VLKRDITYKNLFTNEEVTETHYFHLKESDLLEMQMENLNQPKVTDPATGEALEGYRAMLQTVMNDRDGTAILAVVKDIIRRTYGVRHDNDFLQSPEIFAKFAATQAYSKLYFTLCTDAELQAAFMNGVMPAELLAQGQAAAQEQAAKLSAATNGGASAAPQPESPAIKTVEEVADATGADFPKGTLAERIEAATAENPAMLSREDLVAIDSDELKSGIATGRIKLF
jgi:hypothetical protein